MEQLICGVCYNGIQSKLLPEKDLTYERAFELAQSVEVAEKNTGTLRAAAKETPSFQDKPAFYAEKKREEKRQT